jgi:hypothetical protein
MFFKRFNIHPVQQFLENSIFDEPKQEISAGSDMQLIIAFSFAMQSHFMFSPSVVLMQGVWQTSRLSFIPSLDIKNCNAEP